MSRLLWISLGAAGALVLTAFGCGSIDGADGLFDSAGSSGVGGATSTTAGVGGAAGVTSSGATTASTGATSDAATSTAASSGVTASAASVSVAASSSSGGVSDTLDCGGTICSTANQGACCWSKFNTPVTMACVTGSPDTDGCKTYIANDGLQTRIECQSSAQCDQGLCCGHRTFFQVQGQQKFFYDLVSCLDSCDDVTLCDPKDAADVCPMIDTQNGPVQGVCKPSTGLPTGYFVCSVPG